MADFIRVTNMSEVHFSERWRTSVKFDSYGRFVSKEGKYVSEDFPACKYKCSVKKERYYSSIERIGRASLGILALLLSIGTALIFSRNVRQLFSKEKKVLRFAIKVTDFVSTDATFPVIQKFPDLQSSMIEIPKYQHHINGDAEPPLPVIEV